jgi:hypothetical protein
LATKEKIEGLPLRWPNFSKLPLKMFLFIKGGKMRIKTIKEKLFYLIAIGVSIFLLFFLIASVWIGHDAKKICQEAEREYGGDCLEALISQLEDENRGFRARNEAVWAMGQFGDSRALPALEKYYTGNIPDREPLEEMISQYELKKAINLARGGTNITSWLWRWGIN